MGYQNEPRFQKSQPRFCPSNYKVRSNSPSLASTSGSSIGTSQQRSNTPRQTNTPKRTITPVRHQTPNRFKHRYPNSLKGVDTNVSNIVPAKFTENISRSIKGSTKLRIDFPKPSSNDGYLREFSFINEKVILKTVMAWVPNEN